MSKPAPENVRLMPSGLPGKRNHVSVEKPENSRRVILRLWSYLRLQKTFLLIIFVLMLINTGTTMTGAYLLRPIINLYIIPHNIPGLVKMIFLLAGVYITGSIAAIWQNRLMIIVAQKTVNVIRADLFGKLQSLPVSFFGSLSL